jgi:glutamate decarboxylase
LSDSSCSALIIFKSYEPGLPVVSFRFSEDFRTKYPDVDQKWIQTLLRSKSWIVPNYELAPDLSDVEILRVVIRETVSQVLIERLVADIVSLPSAAVPIPLWLNPRFVD